MAWRIHENIVRGEVDNRERGRVRGRLWLKGVAEPVILDLKGNACADLAGCLLTFENPGEAITVWKNRQMAPIQRGTAGDLTASRKVRVHEIPYEEACERQKKELPVPEHTANSLYLEWFSEANGRVVVESVEYTLTISPPSWRLSKAEEVERKKEAEEGFSGFMRKLTDALEAKKHKPPEDKEWDEFDYEKFMQECDARTDKYGELLDKYRDHPDRDRIIAREMGWTWLEESLDEQERKGNGQAGRRDRAKKNEDDPPSLDFGAAGEDENEDENEDERDADANPFDYPDEVGELKPDPATEGVDWVMDEDGEVKHPLALRAMNGGMALWKKFDELGLEETDDDDLVGLLGEYQTVGAKLAGALDGLAYGRDTEDGAFVVAYLKRALNYLHAAQAALERVSARKLLEEELIVTTRKEFFELRDEILKLMQEFRNQR